MAKTSPAKRSDIFAEIDLGQSVSGLKMVEDETQSMQGEAPPSLDSSSDAQCASAIEVPLPVYHSDSSVSELDTPTLTLSQPQLKSPSLATGKSSLDSENGLVWEGYEDDKIPEKTQGKTVRNLRHIVFSLYRRLFGIVFITNMGILASACIQGDVSSVKLGKIVIANLFVAILMRQDYVINAFFLVFCAVPPSWPLTIRRVCARVYSIGGLHSGCAISGLVWLMLFTVQATKEMQEGSTSIPTVAVTYCILALICGMVLFAYPKVRSIHHDNFEMTHRFAGWTAIALVWCQVILLTNDHRDAKQSLGKALTKSSPFWMVVVMTLSIILPWTRLRKVPVHSEVLSNHALRLYFDYVNQPVPGSFTRVSLSPLTEWHSFATIAEPDKEGYSMIVSRAGDWTAERIANPPKELWVRGIPVTGVMRIVPMFRRVVIVATGSGIGPCAPHVFAKRCPARLLWTSPNVRQTFGDKFVDAILDASPDAVIYDTRKYGKPDMVKLTYRLVKEFDAEAVCIISNQKLTEKVVYGMMSRGIPAFGAIWDS